MASIVSSIHSDQITDVYDMPIDIIMRPIPSELNEKKVHSLMVTLQDEDKKNSVPPIDVLWIKGREGGDYYFSFGGCHRFAAHMRLKRPSIKVKLVRSTISDLRCYLGSSTPELK